MENPPTMSGGRKDKISSWVYSQADEPPEPPPIVPTVLDMPPPPGEPINGHTISSDEEAKRDLRRRARRRAKYPGLTDGEIDDVRSRQRDARKAERDGVKSSSGSGDYDRDRSHRPYDRYGAMPPTSGAKMPNWLRKFTNF